MAYFEIVKIGDDNLDDSSGRITNPYMTSYEMARLIAFRELQLKGGDEPLVDVEGEISPLEIARKELLARVIPLVILRHLPDGRTECFKISELYISE